MISKPSAVQPPLPLRYEIRRPLMSIDAVKGVLDCGEDDVLGFILAGTIQWAWDLAGHEAGRAFVRVSAECLGDARAAIEGREVTRVSRDHQAVFNGLWKHSRLVLKSPELARIWNCGSDHIHDLVRSKLLKPLKAQRDRTEPATFDRGAVEKFMEGRLMS